MTDINIILQLLFRYIGSVKVCRSINYKSTKYDASVLKCQVSRCGDLQTVWNPGNV